MFLRCVWARFVIRYPGAFPVSAAPGLRIRDPEYRTESHKITGPGSGRYSTIQIPSRIGTARVPGKPSRVGRVPRVILKPVVPWDHSWALLPHTKTTQRNMKPLLKVVQSLRKRAHPEAISNRSIPQNKTIWPCRVSCERLRSVSRLQILFRA